jgi:SAM-dependent methyltransferase
VIREAQCPNCGGKGLAPFYSSEAIPVHSCMMFDDAESAAAFPKRDLVLGFCRQCGFISNVVFDPTVQDYATGYEEQQSFSPHFRAFQTRLCESLIEKYEIRGKDVVEIGCGKGDFLIELCERGENRGVGIDPTCDPDRIEGRGDGRVRFVKSYYSREHADLPCDVLCCRHTLEHIHQTAEFVAQVRTVIGDREDTLVFFEVPAVERVLNEGAFWDVYYEHCAYFSLGSLARLFRSQRFDLFELEMDFDDQYLLIVARPSAMPTKPAWSSEDDLARLEADVDHFRKTVTARIADWRQRFESWNIENKRVAIWGSGSKCVSFLSAVGTQENVSAIVDINPFRQGKVLVGWGHRIVAPESLCQAPPDVVVVMNPIYCAEIQRDLESMGLDAELVTV